MDVEIKFVLILIMTIANPKQEQPKKHRGRDTQRGAVMESRAYDVYKGV